MINYSIIIPHKNTPDLLQYCLDSIPVRDDVQVIVVDDNSDVDKVDFEHFPQWRGEQYEFCLTKEGKGAGYARNVGLEHVCGKWVLFVDADDFLLPEADEIFEEEKDVDADIVFFRPRAVMLEDRSTLSHRADFYGKLIDGFGNKDGESSIRCRWFSPCSRFFRFEMISEHKLRFDEIPYSNDALFAVKAGVCAKKVEARDKTFLCITESSRSLTSNYLNKPGELQIRSDAFFRAQKVVHDHGYPVHESAALKFLRLLFPEDKKAFVLNFNRMRELGYKKKWLLHEIFKSHSKKARIKRTIYSYLITFKR